MPGFSNKVKNEALERSGHKSDINGRSDARLHVDHIRPTYRGGKNDISNARVLSIDEHTSRHMADDNFDYMRWHTQETENGLI